MVSAGVAKIIEKCDYDGERIIENLRRECKRVLRVLDDPDVLYSIQRGWFGAPGAAALHDLGYAIEAVMLLFTEDKKELEEACREAIEFKEKAMALYAALKAAPPEE